MSVSCNHFEAAEQLCEQHVKFSAYYTTKFLACLIIVLIYSATIKQVCLEVLCFLSPHLGTSDSSPSVGMSSFLHWYHVLALCLFLWASYHQHVCHKILAGLRTTREKGEGQADRNNKYSQPDGDWFEWVSCPHFFAEILIYVAMLLCFVVSDVWSAWWLVVVYVVSTLSLSARQMHIWYLQKFEDYPTQRRAIIPWIC